MKFTRLFSLIVVLLLWSCNSDDDKGTVVIEGDFTNGVFVLNEGAYGNGNASVSYIDVSGEIHDNIFKSVNNKSLGDVAQSIGFYDDKAFIVVNNSNTIEVVNRYTFESIATIAGELHNPRYIEFHNGKAYVSNWGDGFDTEDDFVAVIDLGSYNLVKKISVKEGPELLVKHQNKLFVSHVGGYGYGDTVSVLDLNSETVQSELEVAKVPVGLVKDESHLYVLSAGKESWTGDETIGALYKFNINNYELMDSFEFSFGIHPMHLQIENDNLYYVIGTDIYKTSTHNIAPSAQPFISTSQDQIQTLYGFNVVNGWIYACDAKDFISDGELFVYGLNGQLQSKYPIQGIGPKGVYF